MEAVQSRDDQAPDEQRQSDSCNTPDTASDRQMAPSQTPTHSSIMDVNATNNPPRQQRALLTLPSDLDIQDDTMQLDDDPVRDSIQRILRLATEAPAPQRTTLSLYAVLDAAQSEITRTTNAYAQRLQRCMQEADKQPPTGVITQGQLSITASWMELTEARHAQEVLDHMQ